MNTQLFIFFGAVGIWLLGLTIAFVLLTRFIRNLVEGSKERDLKKILENILGTQKENSKQIELIIKETDNINEEGLKHVQKVGLIRFNPFKEIGGDHSFSVAVLDGKDTGVVITGLHTRERTRIYAKAIKKGKSEAELSSEEKKALEEAKKN